MKIHTCEQGSGEWLKLRCGIPTCSEFDAIISPLGKIRSGQGPESYVYRKVAEKLMGFPLNDAASFAMDQGKILEAEAIPFYCFTYNTPINRVGFITADDDSCGCSPDGLIGEDGGIEIKCPSIETHVRYLAEGVLPTEYVAQVQGSMFVTGRKWWKFMSYSTQFPPLVLHVERDEKFHEALAGALTKFRARFDFAYNHIKQLRDADRAVKEAEYYKKEGIAP